MESLANVVCWMLGIPPDCRGDLAARTGAAEYRLRLSGGRDVVELTYLVSKPGGLVIAVRDGEQGGLRLMCTIIDHVQLPRR